MADKAATMRSRKAKAVFMAFGTKGDVFPLAAIAAAFACDQVQYHVIFITHSAHQSLSKHLLAKNVAYVAVSSPPVLSPPEDNDTTDFVKNSFSLQKSQITRKHRQECYSIFERIFGEGPSMKNDVIVINFFALEGWSLAELFNVRCVVAAPYVVPYSWSSSEGLHLAVQHQKETVWSVFNAHSSFERRFKKELPLLYKYFQEAPPTKVCWNDVIHWMWPLFTEDWGSWRTADLKLSACPFTDPVTGLPTWHERSSSPLLLYGFSKEVVECPGYWPSSVRVCGFWVPPKEWLFSCSQCGEISALISSRNSKIDDKFCAAHVELQSFLKSSASSPLIFISLSSVGSMGFLRATRTFLHVLQIALEIANYRFILFSAGYEPLDAAVDAIVAEATPSSEQTKFRKDGNSLFEGRLFCFSGSIPYNWLFQRCDTAVHHGGSGSTAAALLAGIPQIICPFLLDQFYWAERMCWLGVAPEPLKRDHLVPVQDDDSSIREAANILIQAINYALSPQVRACAKEISGRLSVEDGVSKAVKILTEELMQ